jgi:hypothetical protein
MLLSFFVNDFGVVPVVPIITGIAFVVILHVRYVHVVRSLYFKLFYEF